MIAFSDIERAARDRDPQLGELVVRYLAQGDRVPGAPEVPTAADLEGPPPDRTPPDGAWTIWKLTSAIGDGAMKGKTPTERKQARAEAWAATLASPWAPPRLRLGALLIALDDAGDDAARAALFHVFANGTMKLGVWQAAKTIYKRAEARHDAAMFGVLACRFDRERFLGMPRHELSSRTLTYLKRRAWRYLRQLGKAVPDAYPSFAVEVLRNYPSTMPYGPSWVAANIWDYKSTRRARMGVFHAPTNDPMMERRAYPEAWKRAPAPALRLLDQAANEEVCGFAIRCLRVDHPLALRAVEPGWLARLGRRPLGVIHAFVVWLLRESPEYHQSKLAGLGLHDVVLGFLRSPNADARAYALDYARTHAPKIAVPELLALLDLAHAEVRAFAASRLEAVTAKTLGLPVLLRLLRTAETLAMAKAKIAEAFRPAELTAEQFVDAAFGPDAAINHLIEWCNAGNFGIPAKWFTAVVDDPRGSTMRHRVAWALTALAKRKAAEIGVAWIQRAAESRDHGATVGLWLDDGMLAGAELDLAWVKGLVAKPRLRALALRLLANRKLVAPSRIGLGWLLEQARSPEPDLHQFASRLLLEHFAPEDFADGRDAGIAALWELAAGKKQPEPVRQFASTYLRAHHPDLGPTMAEVKSIGLTPRLAHADYWLARVRPLLADDRADVRRLAVAIAGDELARWGEIGLLYELAGSAHREPRALGIEVLLSLVEPSPRVPATWLDGARLFALAESPHKATREAALTLIRRAYDQVGGAQRLAWLMESPERDVRLFAVRLFWDRHRPDAGPPPRKDVGAPRPGQRFDGLDALRQFLRTVLYALPPGRLDKRDALPSGAMPERPLPASVAKRRMVEAMRELAIEDATFASAVTPVLQELTDSHAKGEWQACVAALAAIRQAHPGLGLLGLPAPRVAGAK